MKTSLPTITDSFFLFAITFLFCLTGLRFYFPIALSLMLSATLGGIAAFLFYTYRHKKYGDFCLGKREEVFAKRCFLSLGKIPYDDAENFLKVLFEERLGETLSPIRCNRKTLYFSENGSVFAFFPDYFPLKAEQVVDLLRNNPSVRPITVVACEYEENVQAILTAFDASFISPKELFAEMKKQNRFPPISTDKSPRKPPLNQRIRAFLTRKRSKRFFMLGAWTTVFSLFIPFPTYYLISGGIFLSLSAFCLIFGVKNQS
ncbi:MAG: hypothetical protein E7363_06040 [Clostridiales bacterium]|nr:hypothetical protein [Clostridiales bacterium]